jgi:hypothetical protein
VVALPLGAWAVLRPEPTVRVPSFYGLDAPEAGRRLLALGLQPSRSTVTVCEPAGLVVGTTPGPGALVEAGTTVRVRSAVPAEACAGAADRAAAWRFVAFVRGGAPPPFAETVRVVLAGREPAVLPSAAAADPERWAGIRAVARGLDALTRDSAAYPLLVVSTGTPPAQRCGTDRPAAAGEREVLSIAVVPRSDREEPCPLTVDLYRDRDAVVDAVVVYPAGG